MIDALSQSMDALTEETRGLIDNHKALGDKYQALLRELDLSTDTIERQKNDIKLLVRENVRLSNALEERGRRRMEAA